MYVARTRTEFSLPIVIRKIYSTHVFLVERHNRQLMLSVQRVFAIIDYAISIYCMDVSSFFVFYFFCKFRFIRCKIISIISLRGNAGYQ